MNPTFLNFGREALQRMFQKSPTFFKWWQRISGLFTILTGVPWILEQFNVTLPPPFDIMANKAVAFFSAGALFMAQFPVKPTIVAQTDEGKAVNVLNTTKLPFTEKSEAKDVKETVPPPPVADVPEPEDIPKPDK
jgi:hypothetical protein